MCVELRIRWSQPTSRVFFSFLIRLTECSGRGQRFATKLAVVLVDRTERGRGGGEDRFSPGFLYRPNLGVTPDGLPINVWIRI